MIYESFEKEYRGLGMDLFKADRKEYNRQVSDIEDRFRTALKQEYGTNGNPKESLLFEKAWGLGHSAGFSEVESFYGDLAPLIE